MIPQKTSIRPVTERLPDFLIVGEMRCGSTTLWEMLARHPGVCFPEEKELHFFDDRDGKWQRGVEWYSERFADAGPEMVCGEATPDYLFHHGACERIAETVPQVRLVVILRDPVERAWSHYWHNIRRGREVLGFEEALKAEPERMASDDPQVRSHFSYTSRGHYIRSIERFEQAFGREALCVVFLEDIKSNAESVIRGVCEHLKLDFLETMVCRSAPQRNKADYPRWPKLSGLLRGMRKGVKGNPLLERMGERVAALTHPFRTYSGESRMDSGTRDRLHKSYEESDLELERWMGRKPPWRCSQDSCGCQKKADLTTLAK